MISGVVTVDRQAVIPLTVRGPTGQEQVAGFVAWLTLLFLAGTVVVGYQQARPLVFYGLSADGTTLDAGQRL